MMTTETARVWVGCLACYNAGRLVGAWVDAIDAEDATSDASFALAVHEGIAPDEAISAHEEWWVFDTDNMPLSREMTPHEATTIARACEEISEDTAAVAAFILNGHTDWDTLADDFQEAYAGAWSSVEEYAEEWLEDTGTLEQIPESLRGYFAVDRFARDLVLGGDIWTSETASGVYVFRSV